MLSGIFGAGWKVENEEFRLGIVGRDIEQCTTEFEAVADNQVVTVVRVTACDLGNLRLGGVLGISGLKARLGGKFLDSHIGELASAAVRDDA